MKKLTLIAALLFAVALFAQTTTKWIYGYAGGKGVWWTVGPSLSVSPTGQLDVVFPAQPTAKTRIYDALLQYDATVKAWKLPAGATKVVVHVNGLRYRAGYDYAIDASGVKALFPDNMLPEFQVTADYDQ